MKRKIPVLALQLYQLFGLVMFLSACSKQASPTQSLIPLQASKVTSLLNEKAKEKAVLVNIWATWCGPCVEEFPDLVYVGEKYRDKLDVVFISGDFPDDTLRVHEFLTNQKVNYPTWIKTGSESEFIDAIHPEWSGALPFTMIIKKGGQLSTYWENKADLTKLEYEIQLALR